VYQAYKVRVSKLGSSGIFSASSLSGRITAFAGGWHGYPCTGRGAAGGVIDTFNFIYKKRFLWK
jgi:hypothetical protein